MKPCADWVMMWIHIKIYEFDSLLECFHSICIYLLHISRYPVMPSIRVIGMPKTVNVWIALLSLRRQFNGFTFLRSLVMRSSLLFIGEWALSATGKWMHCFYISSPYVNRTMPTSGPNCTNRMGGGGGLYTLCTEQFVLQHGNNVACTAAALVVVDVGINGDSLAIFATAQQHSDHYYCSTKQTL